MSTTTLIKCHINAFRYFEGYPEEILYNNMKQVVVKRLMKQSESELNIQFEDFAGFYGYKPVLCRPYRRQTKGKVERTIRYVRENFMVGIKYNSLADLNSQAHAWCNKINAKIHGTTNERPIDRLVEENLLPLKREYIIDKINLKRVEKDCLISYAGNKYSVPAEYVGKGVTVIVLDHMLAAYFKGKQIALHKLSYSRNTSLILDNYLEKAIHDKKNVVEILDYLLAEEAKTKKNRAVENQIKMSGFPYRKTLEQFDFDFQPSINKEQIMELATMRFVENKENVVFLGTPGVVKIHLAVSLGMIAAQHRYSTYYINCHNLITQLNKAHYENRLQERLKNYAKYKVLIIDEIGYLPMDIQGANLFFQLIAKRYEKNTTIFTSNKAFSSWNEVFSDITIASAILDRILHHCQVISIKGESYRLKERKEMMSNTNTIVNTLFKSGN